MDRRQFIDKVEGSQKAFRRFLVALCCGDSSLADDIAQEAYIKAFLSIDSCRDPDKFDAWIFRIGHRSFLNHRRSEKGSAGYEDARDAMSADMADSGFRYQELYAALDEIPAKERTSVLLHYMQGYSIKEIAEIEETSADAVKQHLSRGRAHLRALISI